MQPEILVFSLQLGIGEKDPLHHSPVSTRVLRRGTGTHVTERWMVSVPTRAPGTRGTEAMCVCVCVRTWRVMHYIFGGQVF